MSAEPATVEIEDTTAAAPATDIAVDTTGAVGSDVPAANDPSSEAYRSENAANAPSFEDNAAPKPFADNTPTTEDVYNDGGKGAQTGDQIAQKQIKEQAVPGDWNIGGDGGGALHKESKADKDGKKSDEFWDHINSLMEEAEERKRQEEHARKWDSEMHEFGGQKLSGAEITDIYKWFEKKENKDKVREQMKTAGKTDKEIDDTFKKFEERSRLWEKMRLGTATQEEKDLYKELGTPEIKELEIRVKQVSENDREQKLDKEQKSLVTNEPSVYSGQRIDFSTNNAEQKSVDTKSQPADDGNRKFFPTAITNVPDQFNLASGIKKPEPAAVLAQENTVSVKPKLTNQDVQLSNNAWG